MSSTNSKVSTSIDILNDSDDDNDDEIITIKLKSQTIEINYFQLTQFSKLIRQDYNLKDTKENLSSKLQDYLDENGIPESSAVSFFKLIQKENIEISSSLFLNLCKISSFFKSNQIKKFLVKFINSNIENISFISGVVLENKTNNNPYFVSIEDSTIDLEEPLKKNINICIQNDDFGKLPISIISHILEESQFDESTSNILYKFIEDHIEDRYVLFSYIELENLSNENFDMLYEKFIKENETKNNGPKYYQCFKLGLKYLKKLKETAKNQEQKIQSLESENGQIKLQLEEQNKKSRYIPKLTNFYCIILNELFDSILRYQANAATLFGNFDIINYHTSIMTHVPSSGIL